MRSTICFASATTWKKRQFMVSNFDKMIEPTNADNALGLYASETEKLFPFFIHREDSEPDRVASRNRLAPTQPLSSSTTMSTLPTELDVNCSFRSGLELNLRSRATVVATCCDFASRSQNALGDTPRRQQPGGRQTDGFRRTIGYEKNQRGVREHLT